MWPVPGWRWFPSFIEQFIISSRQLQAEGDKEGGPNPRMFFTNFKYNPFSLSILHTYIHTYCLPSPRILPSFLPLPPISFFFSLSLSLTHPPRPPSELQQLDPIRGAGGQAPGDGARPGLGAAVRVPGPPGAGRAVPPRQRLGRGGTVRQERLQDAGPDLAGDIRRLRRRGVRRAPSLAGVGCFAIDNKTYFHLPRWAERERERGSD